MLQSLTLFSATGLSQHVSVGDFVGSGSYGTVHLLDVDGATVVGKRAWTRGELQEQHPTFTEKDLYEKEGRCRSYWRTEEHCFKKLGSFKGIPNFRGSRMDSEKRNWMLFDPILSSKSSRPASSLLEIMAQDRLTYQNDKENHLSLLSKHLVVSTKREKVASLTETLDIVLEQLLEVLCFVHSNKVVHRDIKPGNLLVASGRLILLDFGSAADMETAGLLKSNIGLSETVAVSPIYAAPELFVDPNRDPEKFDCFSVALLFCQLLFQYLDERIDAGFRQQLEKANFNLDAWLQTELQGKVRPSGLEDALEILEERPGLWNLLQAMLHQDPVFRLSSQDALNQWHRVKDRQVLRDVDGSYLMEVLESLDLCIIPPSRPLHFVATFDRNEPLGLLLAESDTDSSKIENIVDAERWTQIKEDAISGEVYVQGIIHDGQAESMGIFEVGDRLQGVGELPLAEGGFQRAINMLQDQPKKAKFVTLHFDRKANVVGSNDNLPIASMEGPIIVADQGAWSRRGKRFAQEDAFILHEVHDTRERSVLLAGVMDGHLGTAASKLVQAELPIHFSDELLRHLGKSTSEMLSAAWEATSQSYWANCLSSDECVADYDPREGFLNANTGSEDAVAGTTAAIMALDKKLGHIAVLNCGDSRGVILNSQGLPIFQTIDHKPDMDMERLSEGRKLGKDYSLPQCRFSKWFLLVGEYEYAVSRSLEGPLATSKGIANTPDISVIQAEAGMSGLIASDGLWEVIDTEEVCLILTNLRGMGKGAGDAAKTICSMAIERGSSDNVSVVILYLE